MTSKENFNIKVNDTNGKIISKDTIKSDGKKKT